MFSLSDSDLTREQKEYLQSLLQSGETLLWAGIPKRKLPLSAWMGSLPAVVIVCIWVSIMFGNGFGAFLVRSVKSGSELAPVLFSIPFLLIPFIIFCGAVGSPLWTLYRLGRTLYAVTDRRYLSAVNHPRVGWRLKEWTNAPFEVITQKDGTGDVVLEYRTVHRKGGNVSRIPLGLLAIPHFERVKPLIEQRAAVARSEQKGVAFMEPKPQEINPLVIKIVGGILLAAAACALFFGVKDAYNTHSTLAGMKKAEGVVTHLESQISHGGRGSDTTYRAHYRFKADGMTYRGKQKAASNPPTYDKGEKLTVLYNPTDPQESSPDSFMDNYGGAMILDVVGVFLSIFGSAMLFGKRDDGDDDDTPDVGD